MGTAILILMCSKIIFQIFPFVGGTTHWMVTEDGRIQSQDDSVYNLRRPYDLVAMLKQEERAVVLDQLKHKLLLKKEEIDRNEDRDTGLEQRFYREDYDCISAGKPLPEYDLYISTVLPLENKGIRAQDHIDMDAKPVEFPTAPDCTRWIGLDYSIHAFEHLEGMKDRANLSGSAELGLKNAITQGESVEDYGHRVHVALHKNKTSWVLYNMAAFYWRIKGSPSKVVECLRRALHYSPRVHKDVALISLANILHRARYSNEAAVVVHAALDTSSELNVNHFTLGNIYAVLAEYNKSVICFENTLRLQPEFEAASKRRYAVKCHAKLEAALEAQHRSLQRTLTDLREYQQQHEWWQGQQEKLLIEQASTDVRHQLQLSYDNHKAVLSKAGLTEVCGYEDSERLSEFRCRWQENNPILSDYDFLSSWAPKPKDGQPSKPPSQEREPLVVDDLSSVDYTKALHPPLYSTKATFSSSADAGKQPLPYQVPDWPSKEECDAYVHKFPAWNEFPTNYLPPENKGFEVRPLMWEAQGLKAGESHAFPWYPPVCVGLLDIPTGPLSYDHIQSVNERSKVPNKVPDPTMKPILMKLVLSSDEIEKDDDEGSSHITQDEVGQRILTALKRKIGPEWIVYNLAGLYWRIVGNNYQGIECLRRSLYLVPEQYKDVPLVNLANILYRLGRVDDAITVTRDGLAVNDLEPDTHFFLGNLLASKGNVTGAVLHYEAALAQLPTHTAAFSSLRVLKCYHKFHHSAQSAVPQAETESCPPCQQHKMDGKMLCKTDAAGREGCVIDPVVTKCGAACGGVDMCARPMCASMAKCDGARSSESAHDNMPVQCDGQPGMLIDPNNPHSAMSDTMPPLGSDISQRLDEITEMYRQRGICSGDECSRLMLQAGHNHRPHTRLEMVNGMLHQKLIFVDSPNDISIKPSDCIIYNDGRKSPGCDREEFKSFAKQISQVYKDIKGKQSHMEEVTEEVNYPSPDQWLMEEVLIMADDVGSERWWSDVQPSDQLLMEEVVVMDLNEIPSLADSKTNSNCKSGNHGNPDDEDEDPSSSSSSSNDGGQEEKHLSDEDIIQQQPDPVELIRSMADVEELTMDECRKTYRHINFKQFMSTWVSVTAKGINVEEHVINTGAVRRHLSEPHCHVLTKTPLDLLNSVKNSVKATRKYTAELGLKDPLQKLGGEVEPVAVVGTRIADSLKQNKTSWVLANLAALYWRVEGEADKAIECIKLAYQNSPTTAKDIALLSLANILHKAGQLDDAIIVTQMALNAAPDLVAIHFTMANLLAAKEDWEKAQKFYRATIALQASFSPAKERLRSIQCEQLVPPHLKDKAGPKQTSKKKRS